MREAGGGRQEAGGRRREAGGGRQEAGGGKQEAGSRKQEAFLEMARWRTQFASSNELNKGLRHHPFCFTEQSVTMLSCILNTERSIGVNIRIIRIFTKMREMILSQKDMIIKMEQIEKKSDNSSRKDEKE
jgi:hypothetical protein